MKVDVGDPADGDEVVPVRASATAPKMSPISPSVAATYTEAESTPPLDLGAGIILSSSERRTSTCTLAMLDTFGTSDNANCVVLASFNQG